MGYIFCMSWKNEQKILCYCTFGCMHWIVKTHNLFPVLSSHFSCQIQMLHNQGNYDEYYWIFILNHFCGYIYIYIYILRYDISDINNLIDNSLNIYPKDIPRPS